MIERIKMIMEHYDLSVNAFAAKIGAKQVTINQQMNGDRKISLDTISKIVNSFELISVRWLLTGEGPMFNGSNGQEGEREEKESYFVVPIVHIDSVGGMHSPNAIVGETQYIEGYAPFVDARNGDICIIQSGDSMIPTCPPGCLLLLRQVPNWKEYFGYGNIFVIELTDGRRITKEVTRYDENPKEYVWCVSHNPNVPKEELPKSMIVSVWKVIKVLTNRGW